MTRKDEHQRGGEERKKAEVNGVSWKKISSTNLMMKEMGVLADKIIGVKRALFI